MSKKNKRKQEVDQQSELDAVGATQEVPTEEVTESVAEEAVPEDDMPVEFEVPKLARRPAAKQPELPKEEILKRKEAPAVKPVAQIVQIDPIDVARRRVANFNPSWIDSIRAFQAHSGLPSIMTENECVAFLRQWGAKVD